MSTNIPFFRSRKRIVLLIVILASISLLAALLSIALLRTNEQRTNAATTTTTTTGPQSFTVRSNALLSIKEQGGNISVFPSNTSTITVEARNHGTFNAPDPHQVHILYNQTMTAQGNDEVTVSTDPWFSNTDFYVTIPGTTTVQIAINSGTIDVHTGSGLNASTSSGSIDLENMQGSTTAHTKSGDVTANNLNGPVTISASSGSLRMQHIKGQLNAQTWSGDVVVRTSALSGDSLLQTQNGSVHFDGSIDPQGNYRMNTTSGDVDLTLPSNAAFSLAASTGSGNVENAFGTSVVGTTPRAQLTLQTQNGSIAIVKGS
jgi:hypothetical protein